MVLTQYITGQSLPRYFQRPYGVVIMVSDNNSASSAQILVCSVSLLLLNHFLLLLIRAIETLNNPFLYAGLDGCGLRPPMRRDPV
ncbi:hypothetical protein [Pantoea agglomerans]|uniref:hypothetical protein n=2 Tax=Enterobacter agglomerans TaxID=549 RepID=UPI003C7B3F70